MSVLPFVQDTPATTSRASGVTSSIAAVHDAVLECQRKIVLLRRDDGARHRTAIEIELALISLKASAEEALGHLNWSVHQSLRPKLQEVKDRAGLAIETLRGSRSLTALESNIDELAAAERPLYAMCQRHNVVASSLTYRNLSICTGALVAAVTLGLHFYGGMTPVDRSVTFPSGPLTLNEERDVLSAVPVHLPEYMDSFAHAFFRPDDAFEPHFSSLTCRYLENDALSRPPRITVDMNKPVPRGECSLRLLHAVRTDLHNASFMYSEFLSTVTVRLRLVKAGEFPWKQLRANPQLHCQFIPTDDTRPSWANVVAGNNNRSPLRRQVAVFTNRGLGPAVEFSCTHTSWSGLMLWKRRLPVLHHGSLDLDYSQYSIGSSTQAATARVAMKPRVASRPVHVVDDGGLKIKTIDDTYLEPILRDGCPLLETPLYLRLKTNRNRPGTETVAADNNTYEVVRSVKRLREITKVAWNEDSTLRGECMALNGREHRLDVHTTLPPYVVFYQPRDDLLWYNPAVGKPRVPQGFQVSKMVPEQRTLTGPLVEPVGDDVIRIEYALDVSSIVQGEAKESIAAPSRFLRPRGRLVLDVDIVHPRTGRYSVEVLINGGTRELFYFDGIAPEEYRFDESQEQIDRLTAVLRD